MKKRQTKNDDDYNNATNDNGNDLAPSMTKRTYDHARPPYPTTTTTVTRHSYIANTTKPSLAQANPFITSRNPSHEPICTYLCVFVSNVTWFRHFFTSHPLACRVPGPFHKSSTACIVGVSSVAAVKLRRDNCASC
jgi:hypothetical protein